MTEIEEIKTYASKAFIIWKLHEDSGSLGISDYRKDSFIAQMMDKKFKAFDIDIFLPDELLLIIELCTDSNPGQSQILLKELLKVAKNPKHPTTDDFAKAFDEFPIMKIPEINSYYEEIYIKQKYKTKFGYANMMDTPEYWTF